MRMSSAWLVQFAHGVESSGPTRWTSTWFLRAETGHENGRYPACKDARLAAIADEHGGICTAENAEGGGARFTLRLPVGPAGQAG